MRLILLAAILFVGIGAKAQICIIDSQYTQPGLYPVNDSIPCLVGDREWNDITLQFVNYDSLEASGMRVRIEYVIIDSILNLPCGIKWCTNANQLGPEAKFYNQERGCIRIYGVTAEMAGQYKLTIKLRIKTSLLPSEVPYIAEALGMRVDMKLKADLAATCPATDTTQGATLLTATCDEFYRTPCYTPDEPINPCWGIVDTCTGLTEIEGLENFFFAPNPAIGYTYVHATSQNERTYSVRLMNIHGQVVKHHQLTLSVGGQSLRLDVSALPPGVYLYTISDGSNTVGKRLLVR